MKVEHMNDNWKLLNDLMTVIHNSGCQYDEILQALTTCLAKTIVQADVTTDVVERIKSSLDSVVDFQRANPEI
jgi:hypothetical protein